MRPSAVCTRRPLAAICPLMDAMITEGHRRNDQEKLPSLWHGEGQCVTEGKQKHASCRGQAKTCITERASKNMHHGEGKQKHASCRGQAKTCITERASKNMHHGEGKQKHASWRGKENHASWRGRVNKIK